MTDSQNGGPGKGMEVRKEMARDYSPSKHGEEEGLLDRRVGAHMKTTLGNPPDFQEQIEVTSKSA